MPRSEKSTKVARDGAISPPVKQRTKMPKSKKVAATTTAPPTTDTLVAGRIYAAWNDPAVTNLYRVKFLRAESQTPAGNWRMTELQRHTETLFSDWAHVEWHITLKEPVEVVSDKAMARWSEQRQCWVCTQTSPSGFKDQHRIYPNEEYDPEQQYKEHWYTQ